MVQASEGRPVPALVEALYTAVRRAHRLRSVRVHSSCDKAGLVLLGQLMEQGPMRLSDLAGAVQLDPSTVSRQVRALCEGGFTVALEDPADGRVRRLQISDKGRTEVESVARELGEVLGRAVSGWPKKDVDALTALLTRLADDLAAGTAPAHHTTETSQLAESRQPNAEEIAR
jgi:DNA-binding MarR family transcriptional regulator